MISHDAPAILRHLADPAVRALIVATVAAIILRLLRVKRSSIQLGIWTGVLYAAFAMPLLGMLLPALPLRLPIAQAASELRAQPAQSAHLSQQLLPSAAGAAAPLVLGPSGYDRIHLPVTRTMAPPPRPMSWPLIALGAYALVSCFLLGRLALGLLLVGRLVRGSQPIRSPAARLTLETQARALGLKRNAPLAQSEAVTVPLTIGVFTPAILLPRDWSRWERTKLAAVVAHELGHVKRRDGLTRLISQIYVCLFWFSPLAWWLESHLAELAEQVSDQEAIVAGAADPTQYAEVLMSFFAAINQVRGRVRLHGISMAHGSRSRSRIENVLAAPVTAPAKLRRALLAGITAGAMVTVGFVAACQPVVAQASAGDRGTWTYGSGEGMDFAIVSGESMTMNGSEDDRNEVDSLRAKIHGDFIWFIHDGNSYLIQDPATVRTAKQLYAPMEALGRQQEALGRRQEALGKQQEALGERQAAIKVRVPADLEAQLQSVEAKIRQLGPTASQRELGELQGQLGHIQGEIGHVQGDAGTAEGLIGRQQGELGRRQGRLGEQQGALGREQGRLAREASRKMQTILQQALSSGLAKRVS